MRYTIAIAFMAVLVLSSAARAKDEETLGEFLDRCDSTGCPHELADGFVVAKGLDMICPPQTLAEDDAAIAVMAWLRHASASSEDLFEAQEVDMEQDALTTLWPCGAN